MSGFDDIAFLADSPTRIAALEALTEKPYERNELQEHLGISRSTVNRVLENLAKRGWVVRGGQQCKITPLGERVVAGFTTLLGTLESEARLRDVVPWLPTETPGFDIEMFTDATITRAEPGAPYRPMERLMELGERAGATGTRSFGTRPLPGYFQRWEVREGATVEVIFSPIVVDALRESTPEDTAELLASGTLSFRVHGDLPCGLTLYDDRHIALCGYDQTTGMLQAVVDTDDPGALDWGETVYESYRHESEPVDLTPSTE